jgi:endonuclease YncB( thermonuclease family)
MFPSKKNDDLFVDKDRVEAIVFIVFFILALIGARFLNLSRSVSQPKSSDCTEVVFGSTPEQAPFRLTTPARIVSIYDGDTVTVELRVQTNIRLLDCWAPEITGVEKSKGLKSKEFLETLVHPGDEVVVDIPFQENFSKSLTLSRILARIYRDVDDNGSKEDVSELMVRNGFAKEKK